MMSKIDRYVVWEDTQENSIGHATEYGDWCKYEDVKELVEKLENRIDTLELNIFKRNDSKCIGNLPY